MRLQCTYRLPEMLRRVLKQSCKRLQISYMTWSSNWPCVKQVSSMCSYVFSM